MPTLSIVIVNFNGLEDTCACIRSVEESTFKDLEIILVDNGSAENETIEINQLFPGIITIRNEDNLGFAGGFNMGIKKAMTTDSEYFLVLNNDTIVDKEMIGELLKPFPRDEKIAITSPKILSRENRKEIQVALTKADFTRGYWMHIWKGGVNEGQYDRESEIDVASGVAMMIKREVFKKIGYFNERYYTLHEDFEFSYRVKEKGWTIVYVPTAKIWHKGGLSFDKKDRLRNYLILRNKCLFANEHLKFRHKIIFYISNLYWVGMRMIKGRLLSGEINGFIDGILNKAGKPK